MSVLRALRLPFQMGSLLFVLFVAVVMQLFGANTGLNPLRFLLLYLVLSYVNKYAVAVLDAAANGIRQAPVASVEMLSPLSDPRVFIHPAWAAAAALALTFAPSPVTTGLVVLLALLMPASLAALAAAPDALDTVNPMLLQRLIRGFGAWYVALLVAGGACVLLVFWLHDAPGPRGLRFAIGVLLVLEFYALIGGALHERRLELGFEPRSSPERDGRMDGEARPRGAAARRGHAWPRHPPVRPCHCGRGGRRRACAGIRTGFA